MYSKTFGASGNSIYSSKYVNAVSEMWQCVFAEQ